MYAESAEESSDVDEDAEDGIGNEGSFSDVDDLDSESPASTFLMRCEGTSELYRRRRSSPPRII